ncbi:MAG: hypothetical protein WA005_14290 [Candidatus Binataceae bacterium]
MTAKKSSPQSRQIKQLRSEVLKLRAGLAREARRRKLEAGLIQEAKKARQKVVEQVAALREHGLKLAGQLRAALGDAQRRHKAREEALAKLGELRAELRRKTEELRHKSAELAKLARESAGRAREIISAPAQTASEPPQAAAPGTQPQEEPKEPAS